MENLFDKIINRVGTNSSKFDTIQKIYNISPLDSLSMWTADMDFKSPECINKDLKKMILHGIYGYYGDYSSYERSVINWYKTKHNWTISSNWISVTHGLVAALGIIIRAFSNKGDKVIVFSPVYHSFSNMILNNNREILESELILKNNRYEIDLDNLQKKLCGKEKIMFFCSPHNPGGRVWEKSELSNIAKFCEKNNLILVSDEIHNDLVFSNSKHHMFPVAVPEIDHRLITLVSSTKTFNLAGGLMGNVIISDKKLRQRFRKAHKATGTTPNSFGMKISESAYNGGNDWLIELLKYLEENKKVFNREIKKINGLKSMELQATYLAWVDFSNLQISENEMIKRVHQKAKIAANIGSTFGKGGEKFMRFNLACPRTIVYEAIKRLKNEFNN